jgi:hypothetical protein
MVYFGEEYRYFHMRRIQDAIMGVASPANWHNYDGTSNCGCILTTCSTREQRVTIIISSLRELGMITSIEMEMMQCLFK